jgi:hypothetical protein
MMLGYWPLMSVEDRRFTIFSVVIGFHGPNQAPFVCIKNQLLGGLNLLLGGEDREV